jgi:hypothetical protein
MVNKTKVNLGLGRYKKNSYIRKVPSLSHALLHESLPQRALQHQYELALHQSICKSIINTTRYQQQENDNGDTFRKYSWSSLHFVSSV